MNINNIASAQYKTYDSTALQGQRVVTAFFLSKQLPPLTLYGRVVTIMAYLSK